MTSITITDYEGVLVREIDYLYCDRLTHRMFKSIEFTLRLALGQFFSYKLPLNINIRTACSNINLYADRFVFCNDAYYVILRLPIGLQLHKIRLRKMPH